MTARLPILIGLLLMAVSGRLPDARAAEPRAEGRLRITLKPAIETTGPLVRVADIALIAGGNPYSRERVGRLDLLQLEEGRTEAEVSRTLVEARVLLSDAAPDGFRVDGAPFTRVVVPVALTPEGRALAAARTAVALQLSAPIEEVVVRLAQPLAPDVVGGLELTPADGLEARLSATPNGGQTRVELWTRDARGAQRPRQILVEVRFRQLVPVATRPLSPRHTLTADDVSLESRDLPQRGVAVPLELVIGKALRRPLTSGEVIKEGDLIEPVATAAPVLIKPRDIIRVTARKGTLTLVMPTAEALQSGRRGEMIRVRNTRSGNVVIGRVVAEGEVEVPL